MPPPMPDWKSRLRSLLGFIMRDARPEPAAETSLASAIDAAGDVASAPPADTAPLEAKAETSPPSEASEGAEVAAPAAVAEAASESPAAPAALPPAASAEPAAAEPVAASAPEPPPASAPASREIELEEEVRRLREELREARGALAGERATRGRLEDEIRALADQDALTGVASARRFADRLGVAIVHAQRHKQKLAVVQLGLDGFARVNDRLGRSHGDDLLRSVALALESSLRQGDTIARAGGDVFTVLLPGIKRDEDVTVIADKLRLALRSPFSIGGHDLLVTASLGIALFPDDGPDTDTLLQSATVAMKRAKEKGGDAWDVHAPRSRALVAERQATETQLRRALVQGELELYWQPVVDCESGAIVSVESLLRWRREQGVERAADFVSLADVAGLAVPLGQWTLRAACVQGKKWQDAGHSALAISVNVSQRQLAHVSLVKLVRRVLDETGLPPESLELEVRESELVRNPELAIERLSELRRLGLRVALDDFGSGESRLAHLYRYPLDSIKIDGSVVSGAVGNRDMEAVIAAAIALARSRRLKVVAEGVESEAQRVNLVRWQCDRMQGNLCGPPATAAETERLLLRQRQAARELHETGQQARRLL
jgi:diguanylate cyclase (GGDEF)-like protein